MKRLTFEILAKRPVALVIILQGDVPILTASRVSFLSYRSYKTPTHRQRKLLVGLKQDCQSILLLAVCPKDDEPEIYPEVATQC